MSERQTLELQKRDWGTIICLAIVAVFMVLVWICKQIGIL